MYIDYTSWETFEYKVSSLNLDPKNPRIPSNNHDLNQTQILEFLIRNEKIYDLAKKISEEGYYVGEEPIICIENDKKIVLEGNRRVAALKLLQNPKKYLSTAKANTLLKNIAENSFPTERKRKCIIAPNRLQANPIIYERHNGATLHKWKTGNQYSFVAKMYHIEGLSIDQICQVLNETKSRVLKPLKAYNLFLECQDIYSKEMGVYIDTSSFDFTNLERFYTYEPGREFLGIDFDADNAELQINIPRIEFEKRLLEIFKSIIDAERFSRDFNREKDKEDYINKLKENQIFDLTIIPSKKVTVSKSNENKKNLELEKNKTNSRRNKTRNAFNNWIIDRDTYITFSDENSKLDALFDELKNLPKDKKYSFAILLRTYLEQVLYYYISEKNLKVKVNEKAAKEKNSSFDKKIDQLIAHLQGQYKIKQSVDKDKIVRIFKNSQGEYSDLSLQLMLDYVVNNEIGDAGVNTKKVLKDYVDRIKKGLDLTVHALEKVVDVEQNITAWSHLKPLFVILQEKLSHE